MSDIMACFRLRSVLPRTLVIAVEDESQPSSVHSHRARSLGVAGMRKGRFDADYIYSKASS